jgi:hypothetical protein
MILKEYIKHNATFIHTDSFDVSASARQRAVLRGQLANFLHMQRLIVNMADPMLKALFNASRGVSLGEATQPPGLGDTAYIEAHCHAEIQFERDIQTMVICQDEADESDAKTTKLHSDAPDRYKVVSTKKLKERMQKFADKYGIELRYI